MTRLRDALRLLTTLLAAAALLPAPFARATGAPAGRPAPAQPRLVILAFASVPTAVPNQPGFQGVISREIPREIGRRMDAIADLETRIYAVRSNVGGRLRFAVSQRMGSAEEVRYAARQIGGAFVLDGLASVTGAIRFRARLQDVGSGKVLWQREYEAPTAEAAPLLDRAARDLLSALPGSVGAPAKTAPRPSHEPGWDALVTYMQAEDLAFSLESGVHRGGLDPIFDRYLAACQQDPAWDVPADHLAAIALAALSRGVGPAEIPLRALERLARIRPGATSQAALARGLAAAGRTSDAEAAWQRGVAIDPAFVEGWLNVAEARRARGDYRGAASALEKAVALGLPTPRLNARAQSDLGALYLEIGEVDKAIARLEASVRENPEDPEAHFRLGSACGRKAQQRPKGSAGWIARAEKEFRTADRLRGVPNPPLEPPGKPRI